MVNSAYEGWEEVTEADADIIIKKAIAEYPLLEYYISGGEFYGHSAKQLPSVMADELRSFMWAYITRRLLWCLGFVIAAGVLGIITLDKMNQRRRVTMSTSRERRMADWDEDSDISVARRRRR